MEAISEQTLCALVQQEVGRPLVPDAVWKSCRPLITAVLRGEKPRSELVDRVQFGREVWRAARTSPVTDGTTVPVLPVRVSEVKLNADEDEATTYVRERAWAVSGYLAADADQHGVSAIRERFFGRALTADEARAALASPAVRYLSRQQFADLGIPIHEHRSVIVGEPESDFAPYTAEEYWAEIGSATQEFRIPFEGRPQPAVHIQSDPWVRTLRIEWAGGSIERTFELPIEKRPEDGQLIEVPDNSGFAFRLRPWDMWPGSAFASWATSAENLMREYPWKQLKRVIWFVLTGEPPFIHPIFPSASTHARQHYYRGTVTLEVEPWVPVKVVAAFYVAQQQKMLEGKSRRIQDRALRLFRFVLDATRANGTRPPWKDLRAQWNETYPAEPFKSDSNFLGEYHRVEKALIRTEYRLPLPFETLDGESPCQTDFSKAW